MRYIKKKVTFEKKKLSWESFFFFGNNLLRDTLMNGVGHL